MITGIIISIVLILVVSYISAGKDKDYNKFMGNFRN